jgi:hypothetical protein
MREITLGRSSRDDADSAGLPRARPLPGIEEQITFGRNWLFDHARAIVQEGHAITSWKMTPRESPIDSWDMYLVIEREGVKPASVGLRWIKLEAGPRIAINSRGERKPRLDDYGWATDGCKSAPKGRAEPRSFVLFRSCHPVCEPS